MTLLDAMTDYQRPPIVSNQSPAGLPESVNFDRTRNRIEEYRIRNNACVEASRKSLQTQIQESGEKARIYNEKMQQLKAKKSTKRQRDSSGGSATQKRKLSTSKSDGPASKQANTDSIGAKEDQNDLEELNIFDDLDKELTLDVNVNVSDFMTKILEEDESGSAPTAADSDEKPNHQMSNGFLATPQHITSNTNTTAPHSHHQPPHSIPQQHPSNTPSPQLQQNGHPSQQVGGQPYNPNTRHHVSRQMSHTQVPYQSVKPERVGAVSQAQYNRSISESASAIAMRQHMQQPLERQGSLPGEYASRQMPLGPYTAGNKALPTQVMSRGPQGAPIGPEYTKSLSVPIGQHSALPGAYYSQMAGSMREYPGATGYLNYPTSQYPHHNQPINQEELHRIKAMKAQLARSNSHTGLPAGPYSDPRAVPSGGYYHAVSEPNAAGMHQAHQHPSLSHGPASAGALLPGAAVSGSMPPGSVAGAHPQYTMHARSNYPMTMTNGVAAGPVLSRQLSNHILPHEQPTLNSKISNMPQTAAGPMANVYPMSAHPSMAGAPTYPAVPVSIRSLNSTNPAMISQPQSSSVPQHLPRPGSASGTQVLPQSHMISNSRQPSMHSHVMHRSPSTGMHPPGQQMVPQTVSPPQPQQSVPGPQTHYNMPQSMPQSMPQMHGQLSHHSMQHRVIQQHGMTQPCSAALNLPPQHNQGQGSEQPPMHAQQLQEDLNDLELILSST
ncbi:trithorax group protein osa-like [Watersipora subatra]|uniref:trithorax group protein osa-like n=1 Tax=Watersipora subatra TaxID=2589382 RepID=UPI00355BFD63